MASLLDEFLASLGDISAFIEGAATRVDKNPVINPPQDGDWIIISQTAHVITLYHEGTKVKSVSNFSLGGKWSGKDHLTPTGKFTVLSKDKDHESSLYKNKKGQPAKMPYYVQFAPAVGFHVGDPDVVSHGCVHLTEPDAKFVYDWAVAGKTHVWVLPKAEKKREDGSESE